MLKRQILNERMKLYILAGLVGVVSGIAAVLFRWLIQGISLVFVAVPQILGPIGWIITPILGAFIVGAIVVRYAPEAKGHGVPEVMEAYARHGGSMRARIPILKSIASAVCIGSGGSCGREGPIAQIGAGAGSALASWMKLGKRETKTLLICGLSSGIAATFNAPLGGTLFGIEVLAGGIVGFSIIPVILSSVVATAFSTAILGSQVSFQAPIFTLNSPLELVFYLAMGILFGLISVGWIRGFYSIEDLFERIKVSPYILPAIGALVTGIIAYLIFYAEDLFAYSGAFGPNEPYYPAVMGVGYAFIDASFLSTVTLPALLAFGVAKFVVTSSTLGSGGSGGVFAPTLFMGAAFGGAFGLAFSLILPTIITQPMAFALVGMAALFAGSGRAPITCIVIVMEMTHDYSMILPLMLATSASFLVSSVLEDDSIYTKKLSRRGIDVKVGAHIGVLKVIPLIEVMTANPTILDPNMTQDEVLRIVDQTHHTKFPVVDSEGNIVGTLITEDLFHNLDPEAPQPVVGVLMNREFLHLSPGCKMDSVLHAMIERDQGHAVVVDSTNPNKMIGFVTKADVLRAYELAIFRLQHQGHEIEDIGPVDVVDVA
ncbi:MAG: chloride channel protein [Candidatus Thorarchaeota archaeon]|nr:chloride channel protein [Candidatus Thorarchaeota archaeon]